MSGIAEICQKDCAVNSDLATLYQQLQRSTDEKEQDRLKELLARAVRAVLVSSLRVNHLQEEDAEDVANERVLRVVGAFMAGAVTTGCENGYVWSCGKYAARDFYRKRKKAQIVDLDVELTSDLAVQGSTGEEQLDRKTILRLTRIILEDNDVQSRHHAYQQALKRHIVDGVSLEEMAREDLRNNPLKKDGTARTFDNARESIDTRMHRARLWLRSEVERRRRARREGQGGAS